MGNFYFGLFLSAGIKVLTYKTFNISTASMRIDLSSFLVELAFLWRNINLGTFGAIAVRIIFFIVDIS